MNIVEPILFQCRQNPPAAALCAPGTALNVVSYARLGRFIHNIGRRALGAGIRPGQIVAIQVKDTSFMPPSRWRSPAWAWRRCRSPISTCRPGCGWTAPSPMRPPRFGSWANVPLVLADLGWTEGDGKPVDERFVSPGGDVSARIVLTSGSTGTPKAIAISHAMEIERYAALPVRVRKRRQPIARAFSPTWGSGRAPASGSVYVLSRGGTFFFPGATPMDSLQTFGLYKVGGPVRLAGRAERHPEVLRG